MIHLLSPLLMLALASCELTGPGSGVAVPDTLILRSGKSFGECLGYCRSELEIVGATASLTQWGTQPQAFPDRRLERAVPDSIRRSVAAWLDIETMLGLDERYGCPDCADGGAEWLEVVDGDRSRRVEFEYRRPPEPIERLATVLADYRDALILEFER